jgi:hypothetical protein
MVSLRRLTAAVASLLYVANPVAALQPITAVGSKFFNEDGSQFYIKGRHNGSSRSVVQDTDCSQVWPISFFPRILSSIPTNVNWMRS